jgi:hypothetical protein
MKDLQIPYDPSVCDQPRKEDLSLVYYTANKVEDAFAERVRQHLVEVSAPGYTLISVSQKPIPGFGHNICVGDIGFSIYNVYVQLLVGAKAATTPWICCAEDDYLYHPSHFELRPPRDAFGYNHARWNLDDSGIYWWRGRATMGMCIVWRELLIDTLEERFAKFPTPLVSREEHRGWGEPGRYERNLHLTLRKMTIMDAAGPTVIFNHRPSLGGKRRKTDGDRQTRVLEPWGDGKALWARFYDGT